jgi:NAD(P)H-hydrate epimerase
MMVSALAQGSGQGGDLTLMAAYVCEVHGYAGSLAAERLGSRAVMATDVIDVIGLAADAVGEHVMFPEGVEEA